MAGYKNNAEYNWYIDLGRAGYAHFKATAKKAHEVFEDLKGCVGKEITMRCLDKKKAL